MYRGYGDQRIARHFGFHNPKELIEYQLRDVPFSPFAKYKHWDEIGHKAWANILQTWIKSV